MSERFWCLPAAVLALAVVGAGLRAEEPSCPSSCKPAICPAGGCTRTAHSCTSTPCKDDETSEGCKACENCKTKCDPINQRLAELVSINFTDKPFNELVSDLQVLSGIRIRLDEKALELEGVVLAWPVTLAAEHVSLKNVMNLLLKPAHLAYVVKDDHILISTEARGRPLPSQVFSIAALIDQEPELSPEELVEAIKSSIASGGWSENDDNMTITFWPLGKALVVTQTPDVLEQIEATITALATAKKEGGATACKQYLEELKSKEIRRTSATEDD